jgi:hypothetical protein
MGIAAKSLQNIGYYSNLVHEVYIIFTGHVIGWE